MQAPGAIQASDADDVANTIATAGRSADAAAIAAQMLELSREAQPFDGPNRRSPSPLFLPYRPSSHIIFVL